MKKKSLLALALSLFSFSALAGTPSTPNQSSAEQNQCLSIRPDFRGVSSQEPSVEKIIALGQLGGNLCPTTPIESVIQVRAARFTSGAKTNVFAEQNRLFANGMEHWNQHQYQEAAHLLKEYLKKYPDGLWSGEAELHLGCEARFNGRYNEANQLFKNLLNKYDNNKRAKQSFGNRRIVDKTTSRLAVLRLLENNPKEAAKLFSSLAQKSSDWRLRTYAQNWISQINRMQHTQQSLADCGYRALEQIFTDKGISADLKTLVSTDKGQSLAELTQLAKENGLQPQALKLPSHLLKEVSLPAIAQIDRSSRGGAGHYWLVEKVENDKVQLYDAQAGRRFKQSQEAFNKEWSGHLLTFNDKKKNKSNLFSTYQLKDEQASRVFGGCCGVQRAEGGLGDPNNTRPKDDPEDSCTNAGGKTGKGCPLWKVNQANLNLYVYDIPLWYSTPYGADITFKLSYNSQSALAQNEIFGNKWTFSYGSYAVEDPGKTATVFIPDGQRLLFTNDGQGHFASAYATAAKLERIDGQSYRLHFQSGKTYHYAIPEGTESQQSFLTQIDDVNGVSVTLHYNKALQLTQVGGCSRA